MDQPTGERMKALITGVTGQDGSYLAEFLLNKGYEVHGIMRRSSSFNTGRIDHIFDRLHLHYGDMTDTSSIIKVIQDVVPDEVYNLAAQSHVRASIDIPEYTTNADSTGTLRILEAIHKYTGAKFYQASSSEQYGSTPAPQNEDSPMHPRSPYGIAKLSAYWTTINYRESYNMFAVNGILFNHESPRRGPTFVTQKIVKGLVNILKGDQEFLTLGNLNAKRDWGYAPEYVEAMWQMMQQPKPEDFVIATGQAHTVKDFLEEAMRYFGVYRDDFLKIDSKYFRPAEVDHLQGDFSKAYNRFGWQPKTKFKDLIRIMIDAELYGEKR
jgi:GDPmannose 4,6-dehydratase